MFLGTSPYDLHTVTVQKVWILSNYKREWRLEFWKSKYFENLRILNILEFWTSKNFENLRILKIWEFWISKNFENLRKAKNYAQTGQIGKQEKDYKDVEARAAWTRVWKYSKVKKG